MERIFRRNYSHIWPFSNFDYELNAEKNEFYHKIFMGLPNKLWDELWKHKSTIKCFRKIQDIPENYVVLSKVKAPKWVRDEMTPDGYYLSKTGKRFYMLFDINDIERIKATRPNRYERWLDVPKNLKTKTILKKECKISVEKLGLKPIGDVRMDTWHGVEYIPLYRIPSL